MYYYLIARLLLPPFYGLYVKVKYPHSIACVGAADGWDAAAAPPAGAAPVAADVIPAAASLDITPGGWE